MDNIKEYLVLMCRGNLIDSYLLHKGLYSAKTPKLYDLDTTIDSLKLSASIAKDMAGNKFVSDEYLENLGKCELVKVNLSIDNG